MFWCPQGCFSRLHSQTLFVFFSKPKSPQLEQRFSFIFKALPSRAHCLLWCLAAVVAAGVPQALRPSWNWGASINPLKIERGLWKWSRLWNASASLGFGEPFPSLLACSGCRKPRRSMTISPVFVQPSLLGILNSTEWQRPLTLIQLIHPRNSLPSFFSFSIRRSKLSKVQEWIFFCFQSWFVLDFLASSHAPFLFRKWHLPPGWFDKHEVYINYIRQLRVVFWNCLFCCLYLTVLVLSLHEYGDAFLDCMQSALQASNVASQIGKGFHTNTNTHTQTILQKQNISGRSFST